MPNIRQQSWTPSTIYQSCHKQQHCRHTIFRQLNTQQFETTQQDVSRDTETPIGYTTSPVPDANEILAQFANEESIPIADTLISNNSSVEATRSSTRTKTKRDFLQPKFHGKVYIVRNKLTHTSGNQRVFTKDKAKSINPDLNGIGT
jgi:hypothetical protein